MRVAVGVAHAGKIDLALEFKGHAIAGQIVHALEIRGIAGLDIGIVLENVPLPDLATPRRNPA